LKDALAQAEDRYSLLAKEFDSQTSQFEAERDTQANQLEECQAQITGLKLSIQEL
jgi:hypothetical protein